MIKYLLDTTFIVDYLRKDPSTVKFLSSLSSPSISVITQAETIEGCKNKIELQKAYNTLRFFRILPVNEDISLLFIQLLMEFNLSHGLETMDTLIAATAMQNNLILITSNVKHFSFIKGLILKDWAVLKKEMGN